MSSCPAFLRAVPQHPGQTRNTSDTLEHLAASRPDVVFVLGDLSCEPPASSRSFAFSSTAVCPSCSSWEACRSLAQAQPLNPAVARLLPRCACPGADADLYYSNQTDSRWSHPAVPASQQLRWDAWARLTEPLLATVPAVYVPGNHGVGTAAAVGAAAVGSMGAA